MRPPSRSDVGVGRALAVGERRRRAGLEVHPPQVVVDAVLAVDLADRDHRLARRAERERAVRVHDRDPPEVAPVPGDAAQPGAPRRAPRSTYAMNAPSGRPARVCSSAAVAGEPAPAGHRPRPHLRELPLGEAPAPRRAYSAQSVAKSLPPNQRRPAHDGA